MHSAGGIIIAQNVSDKVLYAIADAPAIIAMEYEISLSPRAVQGPDIS